MGRVVRNSPVEDEEHGQGACERGHSQDEVLRKKVANTVREKRGNHHDRAGKVCVSEYV